MRSANSDSTQTTCDTPITEMRKDNENKSFTDHLERELAQHFALAAVQVRPVSTSP